MTEARSLEEFFKENDIDPDYYGAYLHGLNVGHEIAETGRLKGMSEQEAVEYMQQMFLERTEGEDV